MYLTNENEDHITRAVLVGLNTGSSQSDFDRSMVELKELAQALDIEVALTTTQNLPAPDRSTYIGSGKVEEIASALDMVDANVIIFNSYFFDSHYRCPCNLSKP